MKQPQIFLAHASEDKPEVEKIYKRLENKGYKPWMDKKDLLPGQNWRVEIPNAIKQSQIFIACFSHVSVNKEGYIQQELRLALNQYTQMPPGRIFLIPLKLDNCEIPLLQLPEQGVNLRDLHWLDYRESDAFEKLVKSIDNAVPPADPKALNSPHRIWTRPKQPVTNSPPVTRPSGGNSPTNIPSNSTPVTSQFNNRWFASIGVVIFILVGISTGISLLNQDSPREDTSTSPIETVTQTPEQPTQRKTTSPTPTPEAPPAESLKLESKDYSKLENFLDRGDWKEADQETAKLMLKVADREESSFLDKESIDNFSCPDLRYIDGLWVKSSNGRFGFSVQKSIIQKEGYDLIVLEDYRRYMARIGWRKNDQYIYYDSGQFSLDAPRGHLPVFSSWDRWEGERRSSSLVQRTVTCNI